MDIALQLARSKDHDHLAPLRIVLTHLWRHRRFPDLVDPETFNELVQHRKLHDRDIRLAHLADKVRAKAYVANRIGSEWIIPTLWHGTELPDRPDWPTPFVVKSRHGCNQIGFLHKWDSGEWNVIAARSRKWMRSAYGAWLDEWLYSQIPYGLLAEPFVGTSPDLPVDYKFFVFGGRVEYVQVHLGRGKRHRWIVLDRNWRRRSALTDDADPTKPMNLMRMIEAAEALGRGFEFVRVDLYEIESRPLFGEMTFYPGSGLGPFNPRSLDLEMGAHWLRARTRLTGTPTL